MGIVRRVLTFVGTILGIKKKQKETFDITVQYNNLANIAGDMDIKLNKDFQTYVSYRTLEDDLDSRMKERRHERETKFRKKQYKREKGFREVMI